MSPVIGSKSNSSDGSQVGISFTLTSVDRPLESSTFHSPRLMQILKIAKRQRAGNCKLGFEVPDWLQRVLSSCTQVII